MRPLAAHCHLGLGTLYAKIGRREQARAELSTAIDAVPRHGHDLLAAPGGGGAGAGGGAVMDFYAVLDQVLDAPPAARSGCPIGSSNCGCSWMTTSLDDLKDELIYAKQRGGG